LPDGRAGTLRDVVEVLLRWYERERRDLPWRRTRDPYAILVSEVTLQQTQVARVVARYEAWLRRWPTAESLAEASLDDVLRAWGGPGLQPSCHAAVGGFPPRAAAPRAAGAGSPAPRLMSRLATATGGQRHVAAKVSIRTNVSLLAAERVQGGPRPMPSTYTIHYATPLCFARMMVRNGQHGVHFTCFRPLRYCAPTNEWQCGECGGLIAGELVAARRFDW
jgi:hypothetical protein